jgi:hypothetical protein
LRDVIFDRESSSRCRRFGDFAVRFIRHLIGGEQAGRGSLAVRGGDVFDDRGVEGAVAVTVAGGGDAPDR